MKKIVFGAFLATLASGVFADPDPNFHIYIAFGQSNMEGQAAVIDENKIPKENFQVLASMTCSNMNRTLGEWAVAIPPLFHCYTGLSLADYFGKTMVDSLPGIKIGVIPVAVAGTSIKLFDKDQYASYLPTTEGWLQSKAADYGGNPYGRIIDLAKEAQKVGIIKGILFHQGETDGYSDTWGYTVKKVYEDMLNDLGLAADTVPFLAGEVLQGGQCAGANSQINALPSKIPTAHVVSSAGCSGGSDNLHFNNEGTQLLGKRYAEVMLSLLPSRAPVSSSSESSSSESSSSSSESVSIQAAVHYKDSSPISYNIFNLNGQKIGSFTVKAKDFDQVWKFIRTRYPEGLYTIQRFSH